MRSRLTLTAALALAAATILAVAACGSSVSGSAQANTAVAATASVATTAVTTSAGGDSTDSQTTVATTDDSRLTSLLSELPTDLSLPSGLPTDLTLPTDFTVPSDLSQLTNLTGLDIPGLKPGCLEVASAYASISLALLPALFGGTDGFNAGDLEKSLSELSSNVPEELAPDIKTLTDIATQANGKSLTDASQLFNTEQFTTAQNNIDKWLTANCNG